MSRDISAGNSPANSLSPAARTASANGTGVDLAGYDSAEILIQHGTTTDGTFAWSVEDSPDNSTFTPNTADLSAALTNSTSATTAGTVKRTTYTGTARYIRVVATVTGSPSTGGVHGAMILRGTPRTKPTA